MRIRSSAAAILILAIAGLGSLFPIESAWADLPCEFSGVVAGTVRDPLGEPAAGADVWLVVRRFAGNSTLYQKTITNEAGQFEFLQAKVVNFLGFGDCPSVIARDVRGRIGTTEVWDSLALPGDPPKTDIEIFLAETRDCAGRLVDAAGNPVVGATIAPKDFHFVANEGREEDATVLQNLAAKSDVNGQFLLRGLPKGDWINVTITAEGFGSLQACWRAGTTPTIRLDRPGAICGQLGFPQDAVAVGGLRLIAYLKKNAQGQPELVRYVGTAIADEAGHFRCEGLPPGDYTINLFSWGDVSYEIDCNKPEFPGGIEAVVKPGETTTVSMPLRRRVAVRGRVVDKQTQTGVPGVIMRVECYPTDHSSVWFFNVTDEHGNYTIFPVRGNMGIGPARAPGDYRAVYPPNAFALRRSSQPYGGNIQEDFTCPVIELKHCDPVEGTVVDDHGKPVAGAEVRIDYAPMPDSPSHFVHFQTDAAGQFVLRGLMPKVPLYLRARKGDAISKQDVIVEPGSTHAPVRVEISKDFGCRFEGVCVDETGRPVAAANVKLDEYWPAVRRSAATRHTQTDAEGRFTIAGLWAGDKAKVEVTAEGCAALRIEEVACVGGKTHDLGRLSISTTGGQVAGTVVDSEGKPLAGVAVLNRGYTMKPPVVNTDASGRFLLKGFRPGPAYVFAQKEGYRFAGTRTQCGAGDVTVTLFRKDEPIPVSPAPKYPSIPEQKELARKILDHAWPKCEDDDTRLQALLALARIDKAAAAERADKLEAPSRSSFQVLGAVDLADQDLDQWLSMANVSDEMAAWGLFFLAGRYVVSDPPKAIRCAEALAARARAINTAFRIDAIAQAAMYVAKAGGNQDLARKLAEEAAALAMKASPEEQERLSYSAIAAALAMVDVDRAIEFLKSVGGGSPPFREEVAVAGVANDLEKARKILDGLQDEETSQPTRAKMAYRLAATQPGEAMRLLGGGQWKDTTLKADALGWLAVAAAPRDKTVAYSAIEEALLLCNGPESIWSSTHDSAIHAAMIAAQARQIGYPDMESVVQQALAARRPCLAAHAEYDTLLFALLLSLADPTAARQVLLDAENARGNSPAIGFHPDENALLTAVWGMIDLERANEHWQSLSASASAAAAEKAVQETDAANGADAAKNVVAAEILLAELLSISPSDRLRYIATRLIGDAHSVVDDCPIF